jgi:hypothetical protein
VGDFVRMILDLITFWGLLCQGYGGGPGEIARTVPGAAGPTSIAEYKTKWRRCLKVIGYTADLDKRCSSLSEKRKKALYASMTLNENGPVFVDVACNFT